MAFFRVRSAGGKMWSLTKVWNGPNGGLQQREKKLKAFFPLQAYLVTFAKKISPPTCNKTVSFLFEDENCELFYRIACWGDVHTKKRFVEKIAHMQESDSTFSAFCSSKEI